MSLPRCSARQSSPAKGSRRPVLPDRRAKIKRLTADQVDEWLEGLANELSIATLHKLHSVLKRAIHQAPGPR